jgi:hypothetical protein
MPLFPEVIDAKRQLLAIRRRRIDGVCRRQTPMIKIAMEGDFYHAQGIAAVSFFAEGKKDTSVKPGPRRSRGCARIPEENMKLPPWLAGLIGPVGH